MIFAPKKPKKKSKIKTATFASCNVMYRLADL